MPHKFLIIQDKKPFILSVLERSIYKMSQQEKGGDM